MTYSTECTQFDLAVELLTEHEFEGIADYVAILMNSAMQLERSRHLSAEPYELTVRRTGYANGYKNKTVSTRFGEVTLAIPQTLRGTSNEGLALIASPISAMLEL